MVRPSNHAPFLNARRSCVFRTHRYNPLETDQSRPNCVEKRPLHTVFLTGVWLRGPYRWRYASFPPRRHPSPCWATARPNGRELHERPGAQTGYLIGVPDGLRSSILDDRDTHSYRHRSAPRGCPCGFAPRRPGARTQRAPPHYPRQAIRPLWSVRRHAAFRHDLGPLAHPDIALVAPETAPIVRRKREGPTPP